MLIHRNMPLSDLAQRMGTEATENDAYRMLVLLIANYTGLDTSNISPDDWDAMLSEATDLAAWEESGHNER